MTIEIEIFAEVRKSESGKGGKECGAYAGVIRLAAPGGMARLTLNQSLAAYAVFAACIALAAAAFVRSAPPLPAAQCANMVTPLDVVRGRLVREPKESILGLWACLKEYKHDNWWYTTAGIWGTYAIFKVFGPLGERPLLETRRRDASARCAPRPLTRTLAHSRLARRRCRHVDGDFDPHWCALR